MASYHVAWWNLENLFDRQNHPDRSPALQDRLREELEGWTQAVLQQKLGRLSHYIRQLNGGRGPDILGVCEVENSNVLSALIDDLALPREYRIAHEQMHDSRGIDVGFIYDAGLFRVDRIFSHKVELPFTTRDILQVNFQLTEDDSLLVVVGNHWPSRTRGTEATESDRVEAAKTLAYWVEQIQYYHGEDAAILIMGDFNDEPFDQSLSVHARGRRRPGDVTPANSKRLYNLMWPLMGAGDYSYVYQGDPLMLDQVLASWGLLSQQSTLRVRPDTTRIELLPGMTDARPLPRPIRFGRPSSGGIDSNGASDHLPVSVILEN